MDCSPPGSSVYGISQARILQRVVISYSRGISLTQASNSNLLGRQVVCHWATREAWIGNSCVYKMEKEMAAHSSIPAWRIPRREESHGLQSMELQRVRHDWSDLARADKNNATSPRSSNTDKVFLLKHSVKLKKKNSVNSLWWKKMVVIRNKRTYDSRLNASLQVHTYKYTNTCMGACVCVRVTCDPLSMLEDEGREGGGECLYGDNFSYIVPFETWSPSYVSYTIPKRKLVNLG